MAVLGKLVRHAQRLQLATRLLALWKLARHPDTPRAPKWVALFVLAYALSPIDLIPDFIPVLGQLDDLLLVPLGIALAVRLTPVHLWQARLAEAQASADKLPRVRWGVGIVVVTWLLLLGLLVAWLGGMVMTGGGA
jgi:uncharacterized membrane protein YkvA (DUF1232 family)